MTPRRILILQMCRMGDLLQTSPMLRGIRRECPQADVTLVVLDHFAATPLPSHLYDRLVVFPHGDLWAGVQGADADWEPQLERLNAFLEALGDTPYDLSINVTHSDLSSLLMSLVPARDRRGPVIKPDRRRAVLGGWMQYFWANAKSRALGCFNLVDMFCWSAGVGCDGRGLEIGIPEAADARVSAWLAGRGLAGRPLIAVQLGASEEGKRWPAERFAATVDLLPADSGEIVLVGTRGERPLADRFGTSVHRPFHDALGSTSLEELGALLRRCRLLITNDTGTMHVAAAVGTRVMDISTGPVLVHETGPYGLDHVVVEPDIDCFPCAAGSECHHYGCRDHLSPADAAAIARYAMGEAAPPSPSGVRVLTPRRTAAGRIEFWPLDTRTLTQDDVVRRLSARVWEETLQAPPPTDDGGPAASVSDPLVAPDSADWEPLLRALDELAAVASRASSIARRLPLAQGSDQRRLAGDAHTHLERLLRLAETERSCHPIVSFLLVEIDSVLSTDLTVVAAAHADAHARAAARARRLAQLVRHLPCSLAGGARVAS